MNKVAVCCGTRPDIIKMYPVYDALKKQKNIETVLVHSGQHDDLAIQAYKTFNLSPDYTCSVSQDDKVKLGYLVSTLIHQLTIAFDDIKPNLILVHGDTSTAFSAAVAAFLHNIPVGHIEAGLRTSRFETPFPEEGYRRAISRLTTLHFAPTDNSARNLRVENINENIFVTGNTCVDSLRYVLGLQSSKIVDDIYNPGWKHLILVTCHRTESYGEPLEKLCLALKGIAHRWSDGIKIIWPVHSNPKVSETVKKFIHGSDLNIQLIDPLEYIDFTHLLRLCNIVITDSGGVMEEAAVMSKPTVVLRDETERPEALVDNVILTGYNFEKLIDIVEKWLTHRPESVYKYNAIFGTGESGLEIADIIINYFNKKGENL